MLIKVYITALKKILMFSILFDSQGVGTPIINEWTGVVVQCCHGINSSYIPISKVIRSCNYEQISLKTSNAF